MIVAIERSKFIYLYKYNQIRVDIDQLIDQPLYNLKRMLQLNPGSIVQLFNKALPLFEQDHEIILLEVDKSKIKFHEGIVIVFDSIHSIYPLTNIGSRLLEGKISDDFILKSPIFEKEIEALKIIRSMEVRKNTSEKLLTHFNLQTILNKETVSTIEIAVEKNLLDKKETQVFTTFLDHLIAYNKTPSYIPDGNVEYICKVGAVAIKFLEKQEEVFTNGPFYKSTIKYKNEINKNSYNSSYQDFISITDYELKSSYEKMVEIISKDYKDVNIFKISYFFLAFRSFINKNDNNIEGINNEIIELINKDKYTGAFVLSLLGYTFSIENIYEGLHKLSNAPLLKSTSSKKAQQLNQEKRAESPVDRNRDSDGKMIKTSFGEDVANNVIVQPQIKENENIQNNNFQKSDKIIDETVKHDLIDNINPTKQVEKLHTIFTIEPQQKFADNELATVEIFRDFISKEFTKPKQLMWFDFIDNLFPLKNDKISLETLLDKLDLIPEVKNKLLKTKKDRDKLMAFFNINN